MNVSNGFTVFLGNSTTGNATITAAAGGSDRLQQRVVRRHGATDRRCRWPGPVLEQQHGRQCHHQRRCRRPGPVPDSSTAGNATIGMTNSNLNMLGSSTRQNATVTQNGGALVGFRTTSSGGQASVTSSTTRRRVQFIQFTGPGTTIGSLAGSGTVNLTDPFSGQGQVTDDRRAITGRPPSAARSRTSASPRPLVAARSSRRAAAR